MHHATTNCCRRTCVVFPGGADHPRSPSLIGKARPLSAATVSYDNGAWPRHGNSDALGKHITMLRWALIFLVVAIVAAIFGFTGIASAAAGIAKFIFFLFVALFVLALIFGSSLFKSKT
jgi:uncharacterized membrane protein YtjA (UPF0391 family)